MNINDELRVLVKEMKFDNITFDGMKVSYMDRWYWFTYSENGRETPSCVGFPDCERVSLDSGPEGEDVLVITSENGFKRFERGLCDGPYFELEASFDNVERLIKRGVNFALFEDGKEKFRLSNYGVVQRASVGDGIGLKFKYTEMWVALSENSKIRIYVY